MDEVRAKLTRLEAEVRRQGSALVAYSGGVDSAVVADVAHRVLGDAMLAATAASLTLAPSEKEAAVALAAERGFPLRVIETHELDNPDYVKNAPDRCFHCKTELYGKLRPLAEAEGYAVILNGTNLDDLGDYRPGLQAASQAGVVSPLVAAGLTKADVRAIARELGLPVWDKPATACLASRLPYGTAVTLEAITAVDRAEAVLRERGYRGARVRHHGEVARVEVVREDLARAATEGPQLAAAIRACGYRFVALDLDGYRVGSLNAVLRQEPPAVASQGGTGSGG